MSSITISIPELLVIGLCLTVSACASDGYDSNNAAAAMMMLGAGAQNYGAARASYQPVQRSTYCYPVGRGFQCN